MTGVRVEGQDQVEAERAHRRAYADVPPPEHPPDELSRNGTRAKASPCATPLYDGGLCEQDRDTCSYHAPEQPHPGRPHPEPLPPAVTSWTPIDLASVLDAIASGDDIGEQPTMLGRGDGVHLLYPGRVHALYGETESGKTWIALHACAERLAAGETVLYLDFEDTVAAIARRLLAVGAHPDAIRQRFLYVNPSERVATGSRDLDEALAREPTLTILDGVTESLAIEGMAINDNSEIAAWHDRLPRRIARTGSGVLMLDHVTKDRENRGRFAIGAQHKLAGIDGAAYTVRVAKPFACGVDGLIVIDIAKDRHGAVRGHAAGRHIAEMTVRSHTAGITLTINPPSQTDRPGDGFRPTVLMERVSRVLEVAGDGLSKRDVRGRTKGRGAGVDLALDVLVAEGYVRLEKGERGAQLHHSTRHYREADEQADDDPPEGLPL